MSSTLKNIGYNSIAKVVTTTAGAMTSAILARNLGASDYGVVGVATMVTGLLSRFSDVGITSALVQRPALDAQVLDTAQTLNVGLAALLFAVALVAAPFSGMIFKASAVPKVVAVLASGFLISAVGFLPAALLTREMRFGTLRVPTVAGALARGLVAVICALAGCKYWSLVAGVLAGSLITSLLLRVVRPVSTRWRLSGAVRGELLRFGLPLWMSGLLVFAVFNLDNVVIGSALGTEALGLYTVAMTWATFVCTSLYEIVHSVLFPRFAQMQRNSADLASPYLRSLRLVIFAAVLCNIGLFSVGDGFLVTILGKGSPKWLPALGTMRILCIYGALRACTEPVGNVVMALGRPRILLYACLLPVGLELAALPWVVTRWGLPGAAVLVCAAYASQWLIYVPFLKREVDVGLWNLLKLAFPATMAAACSVSLSWSIPLSNPLSWGSILLRCGVLSLAFVAVHEMLTWGGVLSEIRFVLESRFGKHNGQQPLGSVEIPLNVSTKP